MAAKRKNKPAKKKTAPKKKAAGASATSPVGASDDETVEELVNEAERIHQVKSKPAAALKMPRPVDPVCQTSFAKTTNRVWNGMARNIGTSP